jgi:hypothetical protein
VLDDFKFQREPIDEILRLVESTLKPDQIVGGSPEPPPATDSDKS